MSPAQLEPEDGLKSLIGTPSVAQPAVVGGKVAVSTDAVRCDFGGGGGRNGRASGGSRNRRRLGDGDCVVASVACAPSVFQTVVSIDVELGSGVELESCQAVSGTDQRESAVGTSRGVGELRTTIAADAVTSDALDAEVYLLVEERPETADTEAAARGAAVRGAEAAHHCRCGG